MVDVIDGLQRMSAAESARVFSRLTDGDKRFSLMFGAFPDLVGVQQALAELQPHFKSIRIRRLGALQTEWCSQLDNLTPEQLSLVLDKCAP